MGRPRSEPGQVGSISVEHRGGNLRLRARVRDGAGIQQRVGGAGATYDEAYANLLEDVSRVMRGVVEISPDTTISELCKIWLVSVRSSRGNQSTIEGYEASVRGVVDPACGALAIKHLSVGRLDQIIQQTNVERSLSAAHRLRKILSMALGMAVRYGAIPSNPVRDIQRLPGGPKKRSYLAPDQLREFRDLAARWEGKHGAPRADRDKLLDAANMIVGSSARIGEVLALQRRDIDLTEYPGTIHIAATLQQTRADGLVRKPTPKFARQSRVVAVPEFTRAALMSRLALAKPVPDAYLFATRSGQPYSISNFQRLIRAFRDEHRKNLEAIGIDVEEFTTHLFRRTAATIVERYGGITLASRFLGHSDESITRANYVVTDEKVDIATAAILEKYLG